MNKAYLFVLPYAVFLLVFGIGPSLYAIIISFSNTTGNTNSFNGLGNYIAAFQDFRFIPAFAHTVLYLAIYLPIMVIGVLILALTLHARVGRLTAVVRLVYFLPGAITGSANVLLWLFMLDPHASPFSLILHMLGFKTMADTLDMPHLPLIFAIMAFATGAGGWIVIFFGALQNISREVMEAALIDGSNAFQTALYIKLPLIAKYVVYMLILIFANGIQLFVEPSLIYAATGQNQGSPTWSPNQLAYTYAFTVGNFGVSAAISVGLLLIGFIGAMLLIFRTDFYRTNATEG